jgi:peroxiredoxin
MKGLEAAEKRRLVFMADYGRCGKADIGGKTYDVVLSDWFGTGDFSRQVDLGESYLNRKSLVFLMIDRNGNSRFDGAAEKFSTTQPFAMNGKPYEIRDVSPLGDSLRIVPSTQNAVEIPVPADVRKGQVAPSFEAKTTGGKTVRFPRDYKGKIVLLDFWATWCGPCVGSVPDVVKTYDAWHSKGFEILGVSLDREGDAGKLHEFTRKHHMPWPQLLDGKAWDGELVHTFGVDSIPRVFLVDGTTGKILAEESDLRDQPLEAVVRAAIEKK